MEIIKAPVTSQTNYPFTSGKNRYKIRPVATARSRVAAAWRGKGRESVQSRDTRIAMETAVLSTCDVPTGLARGDQPRATLTPAQKQHIEETWAQVESSGLLENGMQLFKQ